MTFPVVLATSLGIGVAFSLSLLVATPIWLRRVLPVILLIAVEFGALGAILAQLWIGGRP